MLTIQGGDDDLLRAGTEALVNPVNTVGAMGKGLALQFKLAYPENYLAYRRACERREVEPGQMFVFDNVVRADPRWIINFPTKRHWRSPSRIGDIAVGLGDLRSVLETNEIRSVALPALGCGLGGLAWDQVRPLIEGAVTGLECDVRLYPPRDVR